MGRSERRYEVGVNGELTSSKYFLRLTDHNTYGIVTIKSLSRGENKEKIAATGGPCTAEKTSFGCSPATTYLSEILFSTATEGGLTRAQVFG